MSEIKNYQELQKLRILNSFNLDSLEKGGEGSRGGRIIGHTRSGKPVYQNHLDSGHKDYEDFNAQDHSDAAEIHHKLGKDIQGDKKFHEIGREGMHHLTAASNHAVTRNWLNQSHNGGVAPKQTEAEKKAAQKKEFRNASRRDANTPV